MANYQWIAWTISGCALAYAILKDVLGYYRADASHRRELDAAVERRLQALEVSRLVEKAELNGQLQLIDQKMVQAQNQVNQTQNLIKKALQP